MITPRDVFNRLRHDFHKARYLKAAAGITKTKPLPVGTMPFMVLSMVHQRDVLSYLVAIKSFATFTNPSRIVVVCDPSIGPGDRSLFRQQIPHIELRDATEFHHPEIPVGGCWERLHAICQYAKEIYVVQLDADTVTMNMPAEVIESVIANIGFVLGEETGQTLMSLDETSAISKKTYPNNRHIQCVLEVAINASGLPKEAKYVRGCAGFTGFPKSESMEEDLQHFARAIHASLNQRWADWGTEQAASNYLVANAIGTKVLPFPAYATPDVMDERSSLIHFIGSLRFTSGRYRKATVGAIRRLDSAGLAAPGTGTTPGIAGGSASQIR